MPDDRVRRGGGRHDGVGPGERLAQLVEPERAAPGRGRNLLGATAAAVCDADLRHALAEQHLERLQPHLAEPDDENAAPAQVAQGLAGEGEPH